MLSNCEVRTRRDRDRYGGGFIQYVRCGVICKKVKYLETLSSESICSELIIATKKLFYMSFYRPPNYSNLETCINKILLL